MYTIGYDIGSSAVKVSVLDCESGSAVAQGRYPGEEMTIDSPKSGWAEQDPEQWWRAASLLTRKLIREHRIDPAAVRGIGITYQMHGLVLVDRAGAVVRPAIIWCDSRAVDTGNKAFRAIGQERCFRQLLNSPGNFTAAKLGWVKANEPAVFARAATMMLPGDYIAMKLTGEISTTVTGLSEGTLWDFRENIPAEFVLDHFGIGPSILPRIVPTFGIQGGVSREAAAETGLPEGTPVSYRAGDQPNNAFSLNVLNPGEIAATAGTSGVVYGVLDHPAHDEQSRVNLFAHVNHSPEQPRLGVLLCINGTGILNSWLRRITGGAMSYEAMNAAACSVPAGADGVVFLPFGNGAERMLQNRRVGAHLLGVDFTRHTVGHLIRAAHEGIAFSFKYGMEIMQEMGLTITAIRAGETNMFLSPVFRETLAGITGASIGLFNTDGSAGAARGAALGAGIYATAPEAMRGLEASLTVHGGEKASTAIAEAYQRWRQSLSAALQHRGLE